MVSSRLNLQRISDAADPGDDAPLNAEHDFASGSINYMGVCHIVAQTALNAELNRIDQTVNLVNVFYMTIVYHNFVNVFHSINSFPLLYLYYSRGLMICQYLFLIFLQKSLMPAANTKPQASQKGGNAKGMEATLCY
jgi:hypothetical protein